MRKVKYQGPPTNLGRHGKVEVGDVLLLRENEWEQVQDDSRFQLEGSGELKERTSKAEVLPCATPVFDLRKIKWNSGRLDRHLTRLSKTQLIKVAVAMNLLGIPAKDSRNFQYVDILDSVQYHAVLEGWVSLTREEILSGGKFNASRVRKRKKDEVLV